MGSLWIFVNVIEWKASFCRIRGMVISAAVLMMLSGCQQAAQVVQEAGNAAKADQERTQLRLLGRAYHDYLDMNSKGAADWESLLSIVTREDVKAALSELQSRGMVVNWGIHPRDAKQGTTQFALAFAPTAKSTGGLVLTLDGTVQQMSAADLNAMLSAQ